MSTDRQRVFVETILKRPELSVGSSDLSDKEITVIMNGYDVVLSLSEARIIASFSSFAQPYKWIEFAKSVYGFKEKNKYKDIQFFDGSGNQTTKIFECCKIDIQSNLIDITSDQKILDGINSIFERLDEVILSASKELTLEEGQETIIETKRYERSKALRAEAILINGLNCVVCDFNFENVYGEVGKKYIHIHHLEPLHQTGKRKITPKTDLVPVCPNCHAMIHRKNPPYTPAELRKIIQEK